MCQPDMILLSIAVITAFIMVLVLYGQVILKFMNDLIFRAILAIAIAAAILIIVTRFWPFGLRPIVSKLAFHQSYTPGQLRPVYLTKSSSMRP